MGGSDGVPLRTAEKLLGKENIRTIKELRNAKGKLYDIWSNGCLLCEYLTEAGFYMAVTLHNVGLLGESPEPCQKPRLYVVSNG